MAETRDREELISEIVSIELRMFLAVEPMVPSACQEQPDTLKLMRMASHHVLSNETLESYLDDLQEAIEEDRNLMTMKYARIDNLIPCLNDNPIIDSIVEIEERWFEELAEQYPLTFKGRSDFSAVVYLRSELETYSNRTLELYFKDICKALDENINLTAERYAFLFRQIGYDSIEAMEKEREKER